ncbi:MAG: hypothetical protein M3N68_02730 [Actinomycetota bacterium]|nr:hypothetical protein [Actinomycetota bacterium]
MSNIGSSSTATSGALRSDAGSRPQPRSTETRPSFRTSEFIVFVVTSILVIIAAYTDEAFDVDHGWTLVAALAIGYMIARGIAKAGSRESYNYDGNR